MARKAEYNIRRLSEDELSLEAEIHKRAVKRLIVSIALLLAGFGLIIYSTSPIWSKNVMPMMWIDHANQFGWTEEIQKLSERILTENRADSIPLWGRNMVMILGGILVWTGIQIFQNRFQSKLMGNVFTLSYWVSFYWWKSPVSKITVKAPSVPRKNAKSALVRKAQDDRADDERQSSSD